MSNQHWSSQRIYEALSTRPLDVEVGFHHESTKAPLTPSGKNLFTIGLNETKTLAFKSGEHLLLTSQLTPVSSHSCIRTLELTLDASHAPTSTLYLDTFRASMDVGLKDKHLFANGFQSWSASYATADETTVFERPNWLYHELTRLCLASDMEIYDYPGTKGLVHSNLVTTLRDKCLDPAVNHADADGDRFVPLPEELVLCGSLSEDSGYTYFIMDTVQNRMTLSQDCQGRKLATQADKLLLKTFIAWGPSDTAVWDGYAAAWSHIHPDRRAIRSSENHQLSGWTSWYLHYENISEKVILENLSHYSGSGHSRQGEGWPAKVFQIDDGFTTVGDWIEGDLHKFPRGMGFIAQQIREKGIIPGLWLAPFCASRKSKLVKDHPDWFVKKHYPENAVESERQRHKMSRLTCCLPYDQNSDLLQAHPAFSAGAYALDLEIPEVRAHLAEVFRIVVQEWGFKMLKLDFLFAAAQRPRNGKTRGQLMWEAMQMVRTWAGPDTILLGCGVPLGASFMLVDYCRVGCDVGASWDSLQRVFHDREYISCFNSLTTILTRWAMSGRFFGNDPDVYFIRDWDMGLNVKERKTLITLNHLLGHLVFTSDPMDVSKLNQDQKSTLDRFIPWPSTPDVACSPHEVVRVLTPLPGQKDVYLIQIRSGAKDYIVATNLSSKRQLVHLSTMDRIVAKERGEHQPPKVASTYMDAETGQFGSSSAAYSLVSHETKVFVRVLDSTGRMCPTEHSVTFDLPEEGQGTVKRSMQIMSTTGGHALPTTEIKSFEYKGPGRLEVTLHPGHFEKKVQVWVAWYHEAASAVGTGSGARDKTGSKENWTLNGQPMEYHRHSAKLQLATCILVV